MYISIYVVRERAGRTCEALVTSEKGGDRRPTTLAKALDTSVLPFSPLHVHTHCTYIYIYIHINVCVYTFTSRWLVYTWPNRSDSPNKAISFKVQLWLLNAKYLEIYLMSFSEFWKSFRTESRFTYNTTTALLEKMAPLLNATTSCRAITIVSIWKSA